MLRTVIRQQWQQMLRDRRARWGGLALAAVALTAFFVGAARAARHSVERTHASAENAAAWERQGVVDPHHAAHFGHVVFKPVSPLTALDPGMDDHLGTMVRLEAHRQHAASSPPDGSGAALASFPAISPASALQVFGPVLLILATFGTFAGEGPRQLLRQELAGGARPGQLMAGRFVAYASGNTGLLLLVGFLGAGWLAVEGAPAADYVRLGLWLAGYALYFSAILALALGVSAYCSSARMTLVLLLAFWAVAVLLVPRLAPAVAASLYPLPSTPQLDLAVGDELDERRDRGEPPQNRVERWGKLAMEKYGVARVEDLPVTFRGFLLEYSEDQSTTVYREHFAEVYRRYELQDAAQRRFSWFSPTPALRAWSTAMARTDVTHHGAFLEAAENYRYAFVQALNRDILRQRPQESAESSVYKAEAAKITAGIGPFAPTTIPLPRVWARAWPDLAILCAWAIGMGLFAVHATRRLHHLA